MSHRTNGTKQPRRHRSNHQRSPGLGREEAVRLSRRRRAAIIHFTRKAYKTTTEPFTIKGRVVQPKDHVKILGVVMDAKLKYKEHIARAASKGPDAAMALRRLRGVSPSTARQLFISTVAPVVNYASNVWMHAFKHKLAGPINRVERIGAQAIVGTFLTVATERGGGRGSHRQRPRPVLETGSQAVDGHPYTARNEPPSQGVRLEYANSGSDTARHFTRWQTHSKTSRWRSWKPSTRSHWHHGRSACGPSPTKQQRSRQMLAGQYASP